MHSRVEISSCCLRWHAVIHESLGFYGPSSLVLLACSCRRACAKGKNKVWQFVVCWIPQLAVAPSRHTVLGWKTGCCGPPLCVAPQWH